MGNISCFNKIFVFLFQIGHPHVEYDIRSLYFIFFPTTGFETVFYRSTGNWCPGNITNTAVFVIQWFKSRSGSNARFDLEKISFIFLELKWPLNDQIIPPSSGESFSVVFTVIICISILFNWTTTLCPVKLSMNRQTFLSFFFLLFFVPF